MVIKYYIYICIVGIPGRVIMADQRYSRDEEYTRDTNGHGLSIEYNFNAYSIYIYIYIY